MIDLDDVLAHAHDNCVACEGTGVVRCWSPGGPCPDGQTVCESCGPCQQSDVPALVAALREARADLDHFSTEYDAACAEVERLALVVTSLTAMVEAKSSWIDGARIDIDGLEAERDDWRRRYEALRDGVLAVEPADLADGIDYLRAVVARVEGDES